MKSAQIKERELILKLYNEGNKQKVIASILGCSQSKQQSSTEEINTLFDALMQKAFKGELVDA